MRIQPLYDLQQEINRLFIAGAKFAKDDPRLLKVAASLDPLGQKAPVFKKLADSVRELATADSRTAADKLTGLGTLLYSILYTQGEQLEEGKERSPQIPLFELEQVDTTRSYAELARVRELTTASSGRLEAAQEAFNDGVFADFRTFPILDELLADRYAELAEYVVATVMPAAGKAIVPFVFRNFRYENTVEMARRFRVLRALDAPQLPEMVGKIFAESLPDLQVEAIPYLGRSIDNEEMLLQLAGDRNKKVRAAAYLGLAFLGTPKALDRLLEIFENPKRGPKHYAASEALERLATGDSTLTARIIAVVQQSYENIAVLGEKKSAVTALLSKFGLGEKTDEKTNLEIAYADLNERLGELQLDLRALRGKECPETYDFLARILSDERLTLFVRRYVDKREKSTQGSYFAERVKSELAPVIADILSSLAPQKALAFYEQYMPTLTGEAWRPLWRAYFLTAAASWPEERVAEHFASAVRAGDVSGKDVFDALVGDRKGINWSPLSAEPHDLAFNPLWTDILYESCRNHPSASGCLHALRLLHRMEPRESERFNKLVATLPTGEDTYQRDLYRIQLLVAREHPERHALVHYMISKAPGLSYAAFTQELKEFWRGHPEGYAKKYQDLAAKQKNRSGFTAILQILNGEDDE